MATATTSKTDRGARVPAADAETLIHVDHRELTSGVPQRLAAIDGIVLSVETLDLADYLLSPQVVVERKTAADLAASILDRRLFAQVQQLDQRFARVVVLIEGMELYAGSNLHPNALRGALSYLVVLAGVSVVRSEGPEDTAQLLATMARHAQHGLGYALSLHHKRRSPSPNVQIRYLVEDLPGIGPQTARALLGAFPTLEALFCADVDALQRVPGIGRKRAQAIRNLATHRYVEESDMSGDASPDPLR
jgi:fanconi anemia group M protein